MKIMKKGVIQEKQHVKLEKEVWSMKEIQD